MHPNQGQWEEEVKYKLELTSGAAFIEENGMSFVFSNWGNHAHEEGQENHEHEQETRYHAIKAKYLGASESLDMTESNFSGFYRNYILGNNPDTWKSKIYSCQKTEIRNIYPGINLNYSTESESLEYSFVIQPGADVSKIQLDFSGQSNLSLDQEGNLVIAHTFGEIRFSKPRAWTQNERGTKEVEINFVLKDNVLSYAFPKSYNKNDILIIDPTLTFSTFSGSTADNWGFTAAPDANGNLFGAGVVFGLGYPVTAGVFDTTFNGGTIDVGISKFNTNGTALIYSTYYGGNQSETPNSIVSNAAGELFVFGVTSSSNLPMAGVPFDNSYNGGPSLANNITNNLGFTNGSDLYVARLSADGTTLLAATYVGGTGNDGCNVSNLKFNYGDQFRGEIVVDAANNVYVASMTQSGNFPVVLGAQGAINGSQDAVLFKLNGGLNTMLWSTYFGGSGLETGNALELSSTGQVYLTGGTNSSDMQVAGGHDQSANGGTDGYLARFNGNTGAFISGTYIGSGEYDQSYFVQTDLDDRIYVLGQSEADLGVTPGHYGNPNSGQFIRKYSTNLATLEWTTMIGASTGHVEISPTAFLVSDCYDIYLSGWGGNTNQNPNVSQAVNSSTNGFPVTSDAYQSTTNGSNFYIAVLNQDAMTMKYGTFFGSISNSFNHVDGGTSRFDKEGRIYHAVCGACGGNPNGFTTTPGVWSPQNQSNNCNLAAFKFELNTIEAIVSNPDPVICLPDPVVFNNNSSNGNDFYWEFGDGASSTETNPSHLYPGPGTYQVSLIVSDTNLCYSPDTVYFEVNIGEFNGGVVPPVGPICPGDTIQMEAFGGSTYLWSPAQFVDDPTSATPQLSVQQTTQFQVIISDSCGVDTVLVTVDVFAGNIQTSNDTSICIGNDVQLFVDGGSNVLWSPSTYLDDPTSATPISIPDQDIMYTVQIETASGCVLVDSVFIDVFYTPPVPVMPDSLTVCLGSSLNVSVSGGVSYLWSPSAGVSNITSPNVVITPSGSQYYYCEMTNVCGTEGDSLWIDVVQASISAFQDTILCPGQSAPLIAQGGIQYSWWPSNGLSSTISSMVTTTPSVPTMYYVQGTDVNGCTAIDSVFVDLHPLAFIQTNPDVYAFYGDMIQLSATSTTIGPYVWYPTEYLSCVVCPNPIANPDQNFVYIVSYTDQNGCSASDSVNIFYDPIIYVPNTFTPNDDEFNQFFFVKGGNIADFHMTIYNRWGELIFESDDILDGWDGTYDGNICQDGTYTWKVRIKDFQEKEYDYVGHVNLIR